jgi:thiamine biosynthesis lipoprotein
MGTTYSVVIPQIPDGLTTDQLKMDIEALLEMLNQQMSTYLPNSELSAVNQAEAEQWLPVSDELFEVVQLAQTVSKQSDGAFDITVGPLVNLWGFGPIENGVTVSEPTAAEIADASSSIGYQYFELDHESLSLRKNVQGLYLDLSAIAKGYGVDKVATYLDGLNITNYLVEIGGELRARGVSHRGDAWRIALEKPQAGERDIQRIVVLSDFAVATSGDYRNYVEYNGKRFSHTIDPRKGKPVSHRLASVTVLAEQAVLADAWATALMVLGEEEGYKLAEEQGLAAYFLYKQDDEFLSKETSAFTRLMQTS